MSNDTLNKDELRLKLETLERQSIDVQKMKKASTKDYNGQLKEIRDEIEDVLQDLDDINSENITI